MVRSIPFHYGWASGFIDLVSMVFHGSPNYSLELQLALGAALTCHLYLADDELQKVLCLYDRKWRAHRHLHPTFILAALPLGHLYRDLHSYDEALCKLQICQALQCEKISIFKNILEALEQVF